MSGFTYRSARSGSLLAGLGIAIVVETVAVHLWLRPQHPLLAWLLAVSSLSVLGWLATDYAALGRGVVRVGADVLDLRVGRRASMCVPIEMVEGVIRPSWKDVPAPGEAESRDYRNLMKPAVPNVLLTLAEPASLRLMGTIARPVRRLGLRLDDPDAFIAAVDRARGASAAQAVSGAATPRVRQS